MVKKLKLKHNERESLSRKKNFLNKKTWLNLGKFIFNFLFSSLLLYDALLFDPIYPFYSSTICLSYDDVDAIKIVSSQCSVFKCV